MLNRCKRMAETLLPASWIAASTRTLAISVGFLAAGALLRSNGAVTARNSMSHTRQKQRRKAGRMCEVGPPASRLSFFTVPYSRGALNGHPALRGCRLPPVGGQMGDENRITRKGSPPIKVYCLPEERELIEANAKMAGISMARRRPGLPGQGCHGLSLCARVGASEWRPWPAGRIAQAMADRRSAHSPVRRCHDPCPAGSDRGHPGRNEPAHEVGGAAEGRTLRVLAAKLPCAARDTSPFQAASLGVINSWENA